MKQFKFACILLCIILSIFSCTEPETIVPNSNNNTNPDAKYVEGADTTTIKISEDESFNLNNFLVSIEQLFPSERNPESRFEHIFDGKIARKTILHESSFGEFSLTLGGYDYIYNSDSIITSFSYTKNKASQSHFEVRNITYDKVGMIKNFDLTFTQNNSTYTYNFEFDENKYITSSSVDGYYEKNYFYNQEFEITGITREDNTFTKFARSANKDILVIYNYNSDSVITNEYQWHFENNRATGFHKLRLVNGERELYESNTYEYENNIFSISLIKQYKTDNYYLDHTVKFTLDHKLYEYHRPVNFYIQGLKYMDYLFVYKYLNDQNENIYEVKYYESYESEENLRGYFIPTEFNGNQIYKADILDKSGNKIYWVNISSNAFSVFKANGEGYVPYEELPSWIQRTLTHNRQSVTPQNYYGR
ncbi:hypothetical protein [Marinigracilibium pacificum]|uniref:Uncharacterized protein n=1 Tax=Marinigracilibium pacificum TaxID=2729599 RepID=A0A848IZX4_9BACT|nr:hypothetical protein [Marinigracilibium pacificum]NMM48941.1 hypothetical protein [Marinigracilibium pacificum]